MENFDSMAKSFDTDERLKRSKMIADAIRPFIIDGHKKSAMEYGCGTGLVGLQLADAFDTLLFVDSSSGMVEQVEEKLGRLNNSSLRALCCDLMADEPKDLKFDYIFLSLVLHHITDTKTILSRFYNLLNSGGHLLVVDLDKEDGSFHAHRTGFEGHNGFKQSELIELAKTTGFTNANAKSFFHDVKIHNGKENPYSLFILDAEK